MMLSNYTNQTYGIEVSTNQLISTSFFGTFLGASIDYYLGVSKQQNITLQDSDLTRGYFYTGLFHKSQLYMSTTVTKFMLIDFIALLASTLLGLY